ncbi:hypothetical protein [Actinomadura sp. 21ATH]|uniref:IS1096 element passenger TnpR family protein n=1 Tax=Actinomadura sp. 21ATH TaxID=1735444 RepID=UPI0035C1D15F
MARSWLSIRVELVSGHGEAFWPRPGRVFAAARSHTFAQLGEAIDVAFARWDMGHLHMFTLDGGTCLTHTAMWDGEAPDGALDSDLTNLSRLKSGERFAYVFDMGDDWTHICTVGEERIDPVETVGVMPGRPVPYWGWGDIPDQYARRWDGDDGEMSAPKPPDSPFSDLPPILPGWGG